MISLITYLHITQNQLYVQISSPCFMHFYFKEQIHRRFSAKQKGTLCCFQHKVPCNNYFVSTYAPSTTGTAIITASTEL